MHEKSSLLFAPRLPPASLDFSPFWQFFSFLNPHEWGISESSIKMAHLRKSATNVGNIFATWTTKNALKRTRQHARIHWRSSSTQGRLPPNVIFHPRSSSTQGHLPPKVVFRQRSSSIEGCPQVVFHLPWHLSWSYICENSQHIKSQPPCIVVA